MPGIISQTAGGDPASSPASQPAGGAAAIAGDHLDYIDALRGLAILGVIMVHTAAQFPGLSPVVQQLTAEGARGVQLFFVVSAFTLMMSWHKRHDGVISFYIRRLFRIAPMFWLAIALFLALDGFAPRYFAPGGIALWHVAVTALFVHGWHPQSITSVVPGGWSIAVEMTFYAAFPLIAWACCSFKRTAIAFVVSIALAKVMAGLAGSLYHEVLPQQPHALIKAFQFLWFFSQLPVFLTGVAVYHAIREYGDRRPVRPAGAVYLALALMAALPFLGSLPVVGGLLKVLPRHILYGLSFGLLTYGLSAVQPVVLVNRVMRAIGKVSFSAYVLHFAVLDVVAGKLAAAGGSNPFALGDPTAGLAQFALFFAFVTLTTVLLSSVTYRLVEQPMIRLGGRLARRR